MDITRQAKLISKKFKTTHTQGLEFASLLAGFENYHAYQASLKKQATQKLTLASNPTLEVFDPVLAALISGSGPKDFDANTWEIKVKAFAEVKTYFNVQAESKEQAIKLAEKRLEGLDEEKPYNHLSDYYEWEVCYMPDSSQYKITSVWNIKARDGIDDDLAGLQSRQIDWRI